MFEYTVRHITPPHGLCYCPKERGTHVPHETFHFNDGLSAADEAGNTLRSHKLETHLEVSYICRIAGL